MSDYFYQQHLRISAARHPCQHLGILLKENYVSHSAESKVLIFFFYGMNFIYELYFNS